MVITYVLSKFVPSLFSVNYIVLHVPFMHLFQLKVALEFILEHALEGLVEINE